MARDQAGWNGYMTSLGFQGQVAGQINANQHQQIGARYDFEKDVAGEYARRGVNEIDTNQEDRGMLRSGDTMRRQGEHGYDTNVTMGRLGLNAAEAHLDADSTLASQQAQYQIQQAQATYTHNQQLAAQAEQDALEAEAAASNAALAGLLGTFSDPSYGRPAIGWGP